MTNDGVNQAPPCSTPLPRARQHPRLIRVTEERNTHKPLPRAKGKHEEKQHAPAGGFPSDARGIGIRM